MAEAKESTTQRFRRRQKTRGLRRVEVQVRAEDADLVRRVAAALSDPARRAEARAELGRVFGAGRTRNLKLLLSQAPLEGIDLTRSRDPGRTVDL